MSKCTAVLCTEVPKWAGTLSTAKGPVHSVPVKYCDEHAAMVSRTSLTAGLTLALWGEGGHPYEPPKPAERPGTGAVTREEVTEVVLSNGFAVDRVDAVFALLARAFTEGAEQVRKHPADWAHAANPYVKEG